MSKSTEEFFIKRDQFVRYIMLIVNPAHKASKLSEIREDEARECFRIIHDLNFVESKGGG